MSTPWFFDRLGIAPTRDAKQIKRAYALALKAIDQQAEREAFETLRAAYEAALGWTGTPGGEADARVGLDTEPLPPALDAGGAREPGGRAPDADDGDDGGARPNGAAASDADRADDLPPPPPPTMSAPDRSATPPRADPAPAPAAPRTIISNESYGASRLAMRHWMARLLEPGDTPVADILDQALNDPRLVHLDSRVQLEAQIVETLYRASAGRAELFDAASSRFGWGDRNARPAGNAHQTEWISRVINQQLLLSSIDPQRRAAQQAAVAAAADVETPSRQQAFDHAPALLDFDRGFPEWAELSLPAGRVAAWQAVHEQLPEGWKRAAGVRRRHPNLLRIASTVLLVIILGTLIRSMMLPPSVDGLNASEQKQRREADAKAQAAAGQATAPRKTEPVLAFEITGPVTIDSCEAAHEFVHESNWLDVGDADAVTLLSTRALLCRQRQFWPQADDPVLDCLRAERIAALSANRPDAPGHCRPKVDAAGSGRAPGQTSSR